LELINDKSKNKTKGYGYFTQQHMDKYYSDIKKPARRQVFREALAD